MRERPQPHQRRPEQAVISYLGRLFTVYSWQQELYDGCTTEFEQLSRPDTALVVPVTDGGDVLLAAERQPGTDLLVRTLGGRVEPGEDPQETARRELAEEAGVAARSLRLWEAWQPVNKIDWAVYLFVATGLSPVWSKLDAGENVTVQAIPISQFLDFSVLRQLQDVELSYVLGRAAALPEKAERMRLLLGGQDED